MKVINKRSTLLITVLSFLILACEKENIVIDGSFENTTESLNIRPLDWENDRFGEEEDEDIIQGHYEDAELKGLENVNIYLLDSSDSTITDSDLTGANGEFFLSAISGEYLFRLNDGSNASVYTNVFQLNGDVQVTIQQ